MDEQFQVPIRHGNGGGFPLKPMPSDPKEPITKDTVVGFYKLDDEFGVKDIPFTLGLLTAKYQQAILEHEKREKFHNENYLFIQEKMKEVKTERDALAKRVEELEGAWKNLRTSAEVHDLRCESIHGEDLRKRMDELIKP